MAIADHRSPVVDETIAAASEPDRSPVIRILTVDDEPAACKLLALILAPPAFHCTSVCNAEEALVALRRETFDAVISDLQMPGISGLELLARVRQSHPHIAFLLTTGVDDLEVGVQAMRSGADDYLVNPSEKAPSLQAWNELFISAISKNRSKTTASVSKKWLSSALDSFIRRCSRSSATMKILCRRWVRPIDLRDNETVGHSQRVCNYSIEIARAMGWSEIQLRSLARGAHLHDIGKLGIPDGILLKPGPLSPDEWKLMQRHVQIGFDLVKDIPFLADAAEIVLTHHERYDGGGYPRGLTGVEILISSRIFAVADSFDAITSDRPYRRASSFRSGIEIIRQCSGTQFDPQAVTAFLSIPEETWPAIAKDQSRLAPRSSILRESKAEERLELESLP